MNRETGKKRRKILAGLLSAVLAAAMLGAAPAVAEAGTSSANAGAAPEQIFRLTVRIPAGGATFLLPTSGALDGVDTAKPYYWDINWGDGSSSDVVSDSQEGSGIPHDYASAGEYTIAVTPNGSPQAWLAAFGFYEGDEGANAAANKAMVIGSPCSLTPQMTRTDAQVDGSESAPSFEWAYLFHGCVNLVETPGINGWDEVDSVGSYFGCSMFRDCSSLAALSGGFNLPQAVTEAGFFFGYFMFFNCTGLVSLPDGFNLPQGIGSVGDYFAREMFTACTSLKSLPAGFNLPQNLTSVGDSFAAYLFSTCTSLTGLPDGFNLPPQITSVGPNFAAELFMGCKGLNSLPAGFNIPQGITQAEGYFAFRMFYSAGSPAFQFNDDFSFPDGLYSPTGYVFYNALCLDWQAPLQMRSAASIIGGCAKPDGESFTFDMHFWDIDYIAPNWGGGGLTPPDAVGAPGSGDIDGDGFVTMFDVMLAYQASVGSINLTSALFAAADMDFDRNITMADVSKIAQEAIK